jgi:hypothetical protein
VGQVKKESKEKPKASTDRGSVIEGVRQILRNSVYEDDDFCVTERYIKVDLKYDTRDFVKFYKEQIKSRYPRNTRASGTRITIYFGDKPWRRR